MAIDLNDSVRRRLRDLLGKLRESISGVRWVEASQAHVTLKFLGEIDDKNVYQICQTMQQVASQHSAFTLECRGLGAFPNLARPRTWWMGINDSQNRLAAVHQSVEESLRALGFPQEHRAFRAHVTLGRMQEGGRAQQDLEETLEALGEFDGGMLEIDQLTVYASQLSRSGPSYTVLSRSPLAG